MNEEQDGLCLGDLVTIETGREPGYLTSKTYKIIRLGRLVCRIESGQIRLWAKRDALRRAD